MKKLYQLTRQERIEHLMKQGILSEKDAQLLSQSSPEHIQSIFDRCIESNLGSFPLPLGICHNLKIDQKRVRKLSMMGVYFLCGEQRQKGHPK